MTTATADLLLERSVSDFRKTPRAPRTNTSTTNQRRPLDSLVADGHVQGMPLEYHASNTMHSLVHCVGDNFGIEAWMYRSCQFRYLCWDTQQNDFVLFQSPQGVKLQQMLLKQQQSQVLTVSSLVSFNASSMAIGSISNPTLWDKQQVQLLQWSPRVLTQGEQSSGYYALPSNAMLVPFHSMSGMEPTHLLCDDFMYIFNLLQMFDLIDPKNQIMPIRYILPIIKPYRILVKRICPTRLLVKQCFASLR